MKAAIRERYGQADVLEIREVPRPEPQSDEVLIRVRATTVNRTDCGVLTGLPFIFRFFIGLRKPTLPILGTDFAGEVVAIGKDIKDFKIGDRVWGLNDEGLQSQAQFMVMPEREAIALIPDNFTYEEAVACAEGAHYAYNFLNKVKINDQCKVLVNGATGAIGSAAVQMLKNKGAYVTAVVNTKNIDMIKGLGVDKVFNYETENFLDDDECYDYILDAVGKSRFKYCKRLLKEGGIYLSSELGKGVENLYLPMVTKFTSKKVIFPFPSNTRRSISFLKDLMTNGKFKAIIDRQYKMAEIKEAYTYVMTGQKTGNVILDIE